MPDLGEPRYLPGQWVRFNDLPTVLEIPEMVGKVLYVEAIQDTPESKPKVRYEIEHGLLRFNVRAKQIMNVMENKQE